LLCPCRHYFKLLLKIGILSYCIHTIKCNIYWLTYTTFCLAKFKNKFIINEDIQKVWDFYTDIKHLEVISPKELNLKIMTTTNQRIILGQEAVISAKIIIKQRTWHSKITFFQQYEYIDEMLKGPFYKWKHIHKFKQINKNKTEVIDEVEFDLSYGIFGRIASIYVNKKLKTIFEHRKEETIKYLSK
jgi:ligand-binding SRPBCC domain-containing protein